jgi:hypothetical protein
MYGSQLPRRLLPKGTTQEHTHITSSHTCLPKAGGKLLLIDREFEKHQDREQ